MTRAEVMRMSGDPVAVDAVVRIAGTSYDRRRKLDRKMVYNIQKAFEAGRTIPELAGKYGVAECTIRYWVDPEYRANKNKDRNNYAHNTKQDMLDRVERGAYKMMLVMKRRGVIYK